MISFVNKILNFTCALLVLSSQASKAANVACENSLKLSASSAESQRKASQSPSELWRSFSPERFEELSKMSALSAEERVQVAQSLLGRLLNEPQKESILGAHDVGLDAGRDFNTYSRADFREKQKILRESGFSKLEVDLLMRKGVVGRFEFVDIPLLSIDELGLWSRFDGTRKTVQEANEALTAKQFSKAAEKYLQASEQLSRAGQFGLAKAAKLNAIKSCVRDCFADTAQMIAQRIFNANVKDIQLIEGLLRSVIDQRFFNLTQQPSVGLANLSRAFLNQKMFDELTPELRARIEDWSLIEPIDPLNNTRESLDFVIVGQTVYFPTSNGYREGVIAPDNPVFIGSSFSRRGNSSVYVVFSINGNEQMVRLPVNSLRLRHDPVDFNGKTFFIDYLDTNGEFKIYQIQQNSLKYQTVHSSYWHSARGARQESANGRADAHQERQQQQSQNKSNIDPTRPSSSSVKPLPAGDPQITKLLQDAQMEVSQFKELTKLRARGKTDPHFEQARATWMRLLKKYHPDGHAENASSEQLDLLNANTQEINRAWDDFKKRSGN